MKMIKAILFVSNNCPACKPFKRKLDNVMKKNFNGKWTGKKKIFR